MLQRTILRPLRAMSPISHGCLGVLPQARLSTDHARRLFMPKRAMGTNYSQQQTPGQQYYYQQNQQQQHHQQQQQHHQQHQHYQYYQQPPVYQQPTTAAATPSAMAYGYFVVKVLTVLGLTGGGLVAAWNFLNAGSIFESPTPQLGKSIENPWVTSTNVTFDDVKGVDEAKAELMEVAAFLKDPDRFTRLGGVLPKGILLMGPPGTGKTLLAKAIAGEAGVPFFYCSGSEFEEMYVGVGAKRVRDLFAAAKEQSPCIVFIDEIDAIGGKRSLSEVQASRMTLNQLLVEMDGFAESEAVIVVGATNFPKLLDKALMRPGRFDRHVNVSLPDKKGRAEILNLFAAKLTLAPDVDMAVLARGTPGCSGAELKTLTNSAAIKASISGQSSVTMGDMEWAKDKLLMGTERRSAKMSLESRTLTAYHEGGHALVAINTKGAHPIHKATIMPRGDALGMVHQLPEDDQYTASKEQLIAQMDVCMGGRVAEELIFGANQVTSGASSDIQKATMIARRMVLHYGMDDEVGMVAHDQDLKELSPDTRLMIDQRVKKLVQDSYQRAWTVLNERQDDLHSLAVALLDKETLDSAGILESINPINQTIALAQPRPDSVVKAQKLRADEMKQSFRRPLVPPTKPTPTPV